MGNVEQEGVAGSHGAFELTQGDANPLDALHLPEASGASSVFEDHHRHAVVIAGDELAELIGGHHGRILDPRVGELDPELCSCLELDVSPGRHATGGAAQQLARGDGMAGRIQHVFTQEHLEGGV